MECHLAPRPFARIYPKLTNKKQERKKRAKKYSQDEPARNETEVACSITLATYVTKLNFVKKKKFIKPRDHKTVVIVLWGPTELARVADSNKHTLRPFWKNKSKWWDGYCQEEHVVLDDFYGWIKFDEMLRLLDRYPLLVETKGGTTHFTFASSTSLQISILALGTNEAIIMMPFSDALTILSMFTLQKKT